MHTKLLSALKKVIAEYQIEIKDLEWLASLTPVNEVEEKRVTKLVDSLKDRGWEGPPILYSKDHNRAITGSHRIAAAQLLLDDPEWKYDIKVEAINVDDYLDDYCDEHDCTIDQIEFSMLRWIFEGTDLEEEVKKNDEW